MNDNSIEMAEILLKTQAIKVNSKDFFVFTNGNVSPVYVDCRKLISNVKAVQLIVDIFAKKLEGIMDEVDVIAGGETAGIPYAAFLAYALKKPMVYVRKKPKGFGMNNRIEGDCIKGKNVLLVEDLMTDGFSKVSFIKGLEVAGGNVKHCIVVFEYGIFQDSVDAIAKEYDVTFHSIATWKDVIEVAESKKLLLPEDISIVKQFTNNPHGWENAK